MRNNIIYVHKFYSIYIKILDNKPILADPKSEQNNV